MADNSIAGSVGDLLLKGGLISKEILAEANRRRRDEEKTLGRVLMEMGAIDEDRKLSLFKKHFGLEVVSLEDIEIDPRIVGLLPRSFCERHMAVPILRERGKLYLAMEDPSDVVAVDEAANLVEMEIQPVIASSKDISEALEQYPEKDEEGQIVGLELTSREKLIQRFHMAGLFIVFILPLPVFFVMLAMFVPLQDYFNENLDNYETSLITLCCWALWAVTVYEVNGLLFGSQQTKT